MADTRIGGQTPPTITKADETAPEVSPQTVADQHTSTDIPDPANTAVAQKMQASENKGQQNLSGQIIRQNLFQALPSNAPAGAAGSAQTSASQKVAVFDWQESLNKVRVDNGQAPIKEDGMDSEETRKALREFQKQNGINENGYGPETRKRLSTQIDIINLKNNPNTAADTRRLVDSEGFKKLPPDVQSDVINRFKQYAAAGEMRNIGNMVNVIDQPGFASLPLSTRKLMLDTLAARPNDTPLAENLSRMAGSDFGKLDEPSQNWVMSRIKSYGGDRNKIVSLIIIAGRTTPPPPGRPQLPHKNELLTRLMNYPPDTDQVENMAKVIGRIADLSIDVQNQILDGLPYRFDTGQLTGYGAELLTTLVSAQGFDNLHPDKRDEMMNILARRPENTELANALKELAENRRFQLDNRTWRETLERLDASIRP